MENLTAKSLQQEINFIARKLCLISSLNVYDFSFKMLVLLILLHIKEKKKAKNTAKLPFS